NKQGFNPSKHSDMAVCFDTLQKKGRDSILPTAKTEPSYLLYSGFGGVTPKRMPCLQGVLLGFW
ncbi:MAG: hypothetical protein IJC67_01540, partial [Clostridia bacterium]|nr:hypothetical protein [Clostridia bacterium]